MNLALRFSSKSNSGTPDKVAPNTYTIGECCKYNTKNVVPFLSNTIRLKPLKKTNAGFYDPSKYVLPRIKYGNSLQYTAERKTIVVTKYDYDESKIVKPRNVKPVSSYTPGRENKGKVAFCRVPYTHGYSAPSMPPKNSTGYDLDENNKLFRNPPEMMKNNIGPTTYDVPSGEFCFNTLRYEGCAWSKSKTIRKMGITNDNPGPGYYSPKDPKCVRYIGDFQRRPLMRKCCNVPRFTCQLYCKAKFEDTPAPGTYEIVDLHKIGKVKNLSLKPKAFINRAERFKYTAAVGPGPQTYQVCDCFKLKRDCNLAEVPFLHRDNRLKYKIQKTPGPGDYEIKDADYHRYEKDIKKPGFNSTSERKTISLLNTETPDPANYDVPVAVACTSLQKENRTYMFKSMVCRFGRSKDKTDLSAASYNIDHAFKYATANKLLSRHNAVGFNSSEERADPLPDFAGKFCLYGKDTPGVGAYTLNLACSCESKGHCFKTSPRSGRPANTRTPGPDYYQMHPSKVDSLWPAKKTHNYRLLSNVLRRNPKMKGLKLGMRSTVKASRKKILRFFVKTGDFKHCW